MVNAASLTKAGVWAGVSSVPIGCIMTICAFCSKQAAMVRRVCVAGCTCRGSAYESLAVATQAGKAGVRPGQFER
jgi:hypothetical protein